MITSIEEISIGDKVFPVYGLDEPYIATVNPYYILHIDGDLITWQYGGNCNPNKIKFGDFRIFKTLQDAKAYCVEARRFLWDQN